MRRIVSDCTALDAEIEKLTEEIKVMAEMVKSCVRENASSALSQEEYTKKYNALVKRYEKTAQVLIRFLRKKRESKTATENSGFSLKH